MPASFLPPWGWVAQTQQQQTSGKKASAGKGHGSSKVAAIAAAAPASGSSSSIGTQGDAALVKPAPASAVVEIASTEQPVYDDVMATPVAAGATMTTTGITVMATGEAIATPPAWLAAGAEEVARRLTFARQARLQADMEVRNAEAEAFLRQRSQLKARRLRALTTRLACYLVALSLLTAGFATFLAIPAARGIMIFFGLSIALAIVFIAMGYLVGESWRLKAVGERELQRRIEARAEDILGEFEATYWAQKEEEHRLWEERRRRELEEEERRKEAERIADEELLRSIEAGKTRRNRYGKEGSVSSTDIKLPDTAISDSESESPLHHSYCPPQKEQKQEQAAVAAAAAGHKTEEDEASSSAASELSPRKTTPRTSAVKSWFFNRVMSLSPHHASSQSQLSSAKAASTAVVVPQGELVVEEQQEEEEEHKDAASQASGAVWV